MKKIILKISGMHCASCEKIITMELGELPGVSNIKIDSTSGVGELEIDSGLVSEQAVLQTIEKAGYKAEIANEEGNQNNSNNSANEESQISLEKKNGK
ncbi:MAG: heavy-metal-associated domain-containing protein [bacterium]|nr:heavy-metal-associated domain-containing protein [bacterium]